MSIVGVSRALLSVSDKTWIVSFATSLSSYGVELVSTGGTAATLRASGLSVRDVSDLTGFPEMMDGRIKTLHPGIHGGLLYIRGNIAHEEACVSHCIAPIDLLVVDLYPFEDLLAHEHEVDRAVMIEHIDIGGPAMIRSAAKNHASVTVIVDSSDYSTVLSDLASHNGVTLETRLRLAGKAYSRTASYDTAIANWFDSMSGEGSLPSRLRLSSRMSRPLRYGENPHQEASFYRTSEDRAGVASAVQLQGKPLSYNNIADTDAAFELVAEFDPAVHSAVAIIKHSNPCGVAVSPMLSDAYYKARACDSISAFGGIVACNQTIDAAAARAMTEIFTEVIVAPDADDEAKAIIASKKNLRLLLTGGLPDPRSGGNIIRSVSGGILMQERDTIVIDESRIKVMTKRSPTAQEWSDLRFAFCVSKHVKSNAIVHARNGATLGIGAGQMNRVESASIASRKAGEASLNPVFSSPLSTGFVTASDAFFPFVDGLQTVIDAGSTAVIHPGGSIRDDEIIAAADASGIALVFSFIRHFRH